MESVQGFGMQTEEFAGHTHEEIEELNKALTLGHEYSDTLPGAMTGGVTQTYESLDKTLRLVTYEMKNLAFWPDIAKDQANNTVEEFDVQNSYGANNNPFFTMGGTPVDAVTGYSRHVAKVKYVGTLREVHHNLTLVRAAHGPVVAQQVKAGTMFILGAMERNLFDADEAINPLEFDGVKKQIVAADADPKFSAQAFDGYNTNNSSVYDLRGAILDEDVMQDIALVVLNNFGFPTDLYLDTKAHSDFSKTFYPKQRIAAPGTQVRGGIIVPDFQSSAGVFELKSNVFRRPRLAPLAVASHASAPATPVIGVQPANAPDAASKFAAADAGNYYYKFAAFNQYGESAAVASNVVAPAAGDKVTIVIADQANTLGFMVFRTNKGEAAVNAQFIGRVAKGATTTTVVDFNEVLPGLSEAYLMKMDADNVMWKQLAPLMKMDLAIISTSYRWMQLLYGMPMLFTPKFNVYVKNIGKSN